MNKAEAVKPTITTERLYSLDALRAIMLLLGVVLHAIISYSVTSYGETWPLKDINSTTKFADHLVSFIHYFRMPIFFILAGFFAALLLSRRGLLGLIKNRILRIGIPFIIGILILFPLVILSFSFGINSVLFSFDNDYLTSIIKTAEYVHNTTLLSMLFPPTKTMHLWFLYYLLFFYITILPIFLLSRLIKKNWLTTLNKLFCYFLNKTVLRNIILALVTMYFLLGTGGGNTRTDLSFSIDNGLFLAYFLFFIFGWLLYFSEYTINNFTRYAWLQTISACLIYLLLAFGIWPNINTLQLPFNNYWLASFLAALLIWLMFFGLTGLFLRFLDFPSKQIRYIVDASYWVYLIHLPIAAFIASLLFATNLSVWIKMPIVLCLTMFISFYSYDKLVRSSFIGVALNGKKYKKGLPD